MCPKSGFRIAFTVSELLRENQQGGLKLPHTHTHTHTHTQIKVKGLASN